MTKSEQSKYKNLCKHDKSTKNSTSIFLRNVIDDSAGELHVMLQHVDQGLEQQCLIQKDCSETKNRQQRRSITPPLHVVRSGIPPTVTACNLTTSQQKPAATSLRNVQTKPAFKADALLSLSLSFLK